MRVPAPVVCRQHFQREEEGERALLQVEMDMLVAKADGSGFLTLYEVDPKCADLWAAFRAWCAETFQTTDEMVSQLRGSLVELGPPEGERKPPRKQKSAVPPVEFTFIREQFMENAPRHGWFGGFEDTIFSCLDRKQSGYVTNNDLMWFEKAGETLLPCGCCDCILTFPVLREARSQHNRRMQLRPTGSRAVMNTTGPAVKKNPMQALLAFMSFLRSSSLGGNLMQTWRTLLDPDGCLSVQRSDIERAATQVGWRGDVSSLWSALDAPGGRAALEEFGFKEARALALFHAWAAALGGVKEAWSRLLGVERGYQRKRRASAMVVQPLAPQAASASLDRPAFVFALTRVHAKHVQPVDETSFSNYLFSILDWEPHGKLSYKDVRFLESWEPVKWLSEKAGLNEAESFKETVLSKYGNHPVKAWRLCLDLDATGICRWTAFNQAAERIQWKGDCAKAWLGLDKQSLGFITLHNIDAEVAENLALFRRWCFATYGGVAIAFHALDSDGSGSFSEEEFVSVIEHSTFKGDAHAAWRSLNLEGSDILSEREMDFLDDMELDMLAAYVSATEAAEESEKQKHHVEVDLHRRNSVVGADLRNQTSMLTLEQQGDDKAQLLLTTPESRVELLDMVGLENSLSESQSLSSFVLPRLDLKSTDPMSISLGAASAGTAGRKHASIDSSSRSTMWVESSKKLYAGGIPYM
ncbi:unnamed protein product [Durusdinium trenchii]